MKTKLKQVIAKPNNTSIIIYYSKDGNEMKFATGLSISNKKDKIGKYIDWDYKRNTVKPSVQDYEIMNEKILNAVEKANTILLDLYKKNITPQANELQLLLSSSEEQIIASANTFIIDAYEEFYKMKSEKFYANGTPASLKDFTSTKNLIKDFEIYKEIKYKIYQFIPSWYREMLNFMKLPHHNEVNANKKYITFGDMNAKTCRKRFDIFVSFSEHLKERKLCTQEFIDDLKRFRKKEIRVPKTDKVTLDIDEIYAVYDYKFKTPSHETIKDVFVFLCLTGLRYQDYLRFDSKFIKPSKISGTKIYERKAIKTKGSSGLNYQIPMCDTALEILNKYDNKLPHPPNPNIAIKAALKETDYFTEPSQIVDKKTGLEKMKYECISLHKGRDSFITNLVDFAPLNQLMKYTGHSKLSTLQGYIDNSREVDTTPIKIFNRKKAQ